MAKHETSHSLFVCEWVGYKIILIFHESIVCGGVSGWKSNEDNGTEDSDDDRA